MSHRPQPSGSARSEPLSGQNLGQNPGQTHVQNHAQYPAQNHEPNEAPEHPRKHTAKHTAKLVPETTPDLTIVIVNYNTRAMTRACLDSVADQTKSLSYELILVDNASTDGSVADLATHPAITKLIALSQNIGFARANTLAGKYAKGRYLLLLNPDTVVRDRAIEHLVCFANCCPEAKIWGGRTVFADGQLNPSSCWNRMTFWNLLCRATGLTGLFPASEIFNSEALGAWPRDRLRVVDIVSGCFFLTTTHFWRQLGGFDPRFFMYGEEADLCLRARHLGATPMVTPNATIVHLGGASERTRVGKMVKLLAAKATLIDCHFAPGTRWLGRALLAAWPLSRWLACAAATALTGEKRFQDQATTWQEIWRNRTAWRQGYAASPSAPYHTTGAAAPPPQSHPTAKTSSSASKSIAGRQAVHNLAAKAQNIIATARGKRTPVITPSATPNPPSYASTPSANQSSPPQKPYAKPVVDALSV